MQHGNWSYTFPPNSEGTDSSIIARKENASPRKLGVIKTMREVCIEGQLPEVPGGERFREGRNR